MAAVALARFAGAQVIATVRSDAQQSVAADAGAQAVVRTDGVASAEVVSRVLDIAPDGVDHIVEVAFQANVAVDEQVLRQGGSIATYASGDPSPTIPFWPLIFKNVSIQFLGSDDFTPDHKAQAASDLSAALAAGWAGYSIGGEYPLEHIAQAHKAVEDRSPEGRIVMNLSGGAF
jgi:NADPH2:quinone reductase